MATAARGSDAASRAVEKLREVVRLAGADGFAKVSDAAIGTRLRAVWPAAAIAWEERPERARVDAGLAAWDDSGRQSRVEIVALLMRLLAQRGGAPKRAPPAPATTSSDPRDAGVDTLPGVGPATAAAIIDHRESSGPFDSVEDLLDVRGIGDAKLEALRDLVSVGSGW